MVFAALCRARLDRLQESPEAALAFLGSHGAHYQSLRLDRPVAYMLAEQVRILLAKGERARVGRARAKLDELANAAPGLRAASLAEIPAVAA
jgi:LuxR family maltose regulon positive regulatory protein